jgi:UDP-GlcNAc:undecaprenyl-phosphate/decaprenyl-phosphate GlcNAc-1-phosphate transferase
VTVAAALAAFPASLITIRLLLSTPAARHVVAAPRADRWHVKSTPLLGGSGIFAGIVAGCLVAVAAGRIHFDEQLVGILGGCAILFTAGLVDDLLTLNPLTKIAAQVGAAALALSTGEHVQIISNDVLATIVGGLWLVGMTNAFNLLDNMDGLAATLAAIACAFFAVDALTRHNHPVIAAGALSTCFATLGFLPYNLRLRRRAAVFMGDSGSQVLGFAVGVLGLGSAWTAAGSGAATILLPVLVLAVPLLDTTLVTVVRLLEGRPVTQGGRDHTSHRLVYEGLSDKRAVVLLAIVSAALGTTALAYRLLDNTLLTLVGVLVTFAFLVQFGSYLAGSIRSEDTSTSTGLLRSLIGNRRRFVEVVVDFTLITASFTLAFMIRVRGTDLGIFRHVFERTLPALLVARYIAFILFGLYRGVWRYAGATDAARIFTAMVASEAAAFFFIWGTVGWHLFPRGTFLIDLLLCTFLIGAARFSERGVSHALRTFVDRQSRRRVVIVGAGRSGRSLLRELRETPGEQVVAFVDDDAALRRRRIQGVTVAGALDEIGLVLGRLAPDAVLVTIPDADHDRLDGVVEACSRAGVACRFVRREIDIDPTVALGAAIE